MSKNSSSGYAKNRSDVGQGGWRYEYLKTVVLPSYMTVKTQMD